MSINKIRTFDNRWALSVEKEDINAHFKQPKIHLRTTYGTTLSRPEFRLGENNQLLALYLVDDFDARLEAFEYDGGKNELSMFNTIEERDRYLQEQESEGKRCLKVAREGSMVVKFVLEGPTNAASCPDTVSFGVFIPSPSDQISLQDGYMSDEQLLAKAERLLDEYTEFSNGESYRIQIDVYERNDHGDFLRVDQVTLSGFHGEDRAIEGLKAEANHYRPVPAYQPTRSEPEAETPEL